MAETLDAAGFAARIEQLRAPVDVAKARAGDLDDTFALGALLAADEHDLVQKVVGGVVREAGKRDRDRLLAFLDGHAAGAAPVVVRYAAEHLDQDTRARYLHGRVSRRAAPPAARDAVPRRRAGS